MVVAPIATGRMTIRPIESADRAEFLRVPRVRHRIREGAGLGLHRVQANIIPSNLPSSRLAERAGFRLEGLARKYLKIAGEWQDHLMFAQLVDEHRPTWLGQKET